MKDTTTRGAGPAERARHAGDAAPAGTGAAAVSADVGQTQAGAVLRLLWGKDLELISHEAG